MFSDAYGVVCVCVMADGCCECIGAIMLMGGLPAMLICACLICQGISVFLPSVLSGVTERSDVFCVIFGRCIFRGASTYSILAGVKY